MVKLSWTAPGAASGLLINEGFEGEGLPANWTVIDADGDGNNWTTSPAPVN